MPINLYILRGSSRNNLIRPPSLLLMAMIFMPHEQLVLVQLFMEPMMHYDASVVAVYAGGGGYGDSQY